MPYDQNHKIEACLVCGGAANVIRHISQFVVCCSWCGDFDIPGEIAKDTRLPIVETYKVALARYLLQRLQGRLVPGLPWQRTRPVLSTEFFEALNRRSLPTPTEATDNLLLLLGRECCGRPGMRLSVEFNSPALISEIGAIDEDDVGWHFRNLVALKWFEGPLTLGVAAGHLTGRGWSRIEELQTAQSPYKFAYFARKFPNIDLDTVFKNCLVDAVRQTGFELRSAIQNAGAIDAVVEDEIRRCSFVVADLTDDNPGAYWEAGLAEGLGKPVIYLCKSKVGANDNRTHFDANHRQIIQWDMASLDQTANKLKASIRNTLLEAATQSDDATAGPSVPRSIIRYAN